MGKKVSVIIPVYNVADLLGRCLQSVVNQSYKELEIILVDDGSTDGSGKLCDEWTERDCRIKVIHQNNQGLSAARNVGTGAATGEYLQYVDSDDWIEADFIEKLMNSIQKYDADMAVCGIIKTDGVHEDVWKWFQEEQLFSQKEGLELLIKCGSITSHAWNKLYKKAIIEKHPFPIGKLYEDVRIMHKIFEECHRISIVPESLYYYYQHSNSITSLQKVENKFAYIEAFADRYYDIKDTMPQYANILLAQIAIVTSLVLVQCRFSEEEIKLYKNDFLKLKEFLNRRYIKSFVKEYATKSQYLYYQAAKRFSYKANGPYGRFIQPFIKHEKRRNRDV